MLHITSCTFQLQISFFLGFQNLLMLQFAPDYSQYHQTSLKRSKWIHSLFPEFQIINVNCQHLLILFNIQLLVPHLIFQAQVEQGKVEAIVWISKVELSFLRYSCYQQFCFNSSSKMEFHGKLCCNIKMIFVGRDKSLHNVQCHWKDICARIRVISLTRNHPF